MLDALRRGAQSWIAKVLFAILVFSFAIWGVADVFRGYGQGALARIGSTEISTEEFRQAYQTQLDDVRRRFGSRLTPEQARAFGLDAQVLARLIGSAAIGAHARQLNLGMTDAAIVEAIRGDTTFQGPDGKFNKLAFDSFLRQVGLSEHGYLAARRREEVREQLTDALVRGVAAPQPLIDLMYAFREESRVVQHFTVDPAKVAALAEPDEAALKATYEQNKAKFVNPELRKLAVLLLTTDQAKKKVTVGDEEIKAAYEQDPARFNVAEMRRVQQIAFKDRATAEAALRAIKAGQSFLDAAKEAGAQESDINLGRLAKRDLFDARIADAAFALPKDQVSDVIDGQFATVLLKVTEIEPGKQRSLEDVKGEIRDRIAGEKASRDIQKLHDQVDDEKSAGKTLKETADKLGLTYVEVAGTDRTGKAPDGKPAFEGPDGQKIVASAFDGKVGVENEAVETTDGGYAWVDVLGVTPEKQKPFEEVAEDVKKVWADAERRKALNEAAARLVERARGGAPLEALAADAGGKVETSLPFRRFGAAPGLPESAVRAAFAVAKGASAYAETSDGTSRIILRVLEVAAPPPPTKDQADRLEADLARQIQADVMAEYVAALQQRLGVSINEAEFRRATGVDRQ